ncbi:hypothetical protein [Paenibacillus sp. sgz302251]|uniref:hypothetical protein n=1 Tax=Paenibacillus sp. sgz302251 TaxID=3414493 RepID=UPI003C7CAC4B
MQNGLMVLIQAAKTQGLGFLRFLFFQEFTSVLQTFEGGRAKERGKENAIDLKRSMLEELERVTGKKYFIGEEKKKSMDLKHNPFSVSAYYHRREKAAGRRRQKS